MASSGPDKGIAKIAKIAKIDDDDTEGHIAKIAKIAKVEGDDTEGHIAKVAKEDVEAGPVEGVPPEAPAPAQE